MTTIITRGSVSAQALGYAARATAANYIEDVFSTYLFTGNGSTQTITNGIDLSTKGGMVWLKSRSAATNNFLFDTSRGVLNELNSNTTDAQASLAASLTAFNTTGFSLGAAAGINVSAATYASWTFREQAKFFDVVTYTGNGVAGRTVAHNLGSVPGCIIVKSTDVSGFWRVYHRSIGNTGGLSLSQTTSTATTATYWNNTSPTSTEFTLGDATAVNGNGGSFVAYLFAHDAGGFGASGADNVISCGTFTADGSGNATVTLGYEPQWIIVKRSDGVQDWYINDNMRGWPNSPPTQGQGLFANTSAAETAATLTIPTATGFFTSGFPAPGTYIYIAIRRGPMKVPTSGTSVFSPNAATDTEGQGTVKTTNFPVDLQITRARGGGQNWTVDRLRGVSTTATDTGPSVLITNSTDAQSSGTFAITRAWNNTGFQITSAIGNSSQIYWNFRRAPGFFDEVCYTGTGVTRTVTHNLGAVPELMIVKTRGTSNFWYVYSAPTGNTKRLLLDQTNGAAIDNPWNNTSPTSSVFTVIGSNDGVNFSSYTYVAYLFATVAGVSKVGSYTGNGSSQTVNCGFTAGSRFVMIKRTDSTGNWTVFDSARGIVAGNDPALYLNSTAAEVTTVDAVDTDNSGFIVNQETTLNLNVNAASYVFLAIA